MKSLDFEGRYYRMYPKDHFLGYAYETVSLDPASTAFVLVDVYGLGFSEEDFDGHACPSLMGSFMFEKEKDIVCNHIKPALEAARSAGLPVIYISNSGPRIHIKGSELYKQLKRSFDIELDELFKEDNVDPLEYMYGENSFLKISKVLTPRPNEYFIRKYYYSGFYETRLDSLLRDLGVKSLVYVGFAADCCLHATMVDGLNRNYETILLRDCTLAVETPEEAESLVLTNRMIHWAEYYLGRTATAADFAKACAV